MEIGDEIHKPQMMAMIPTDVQCVVGILASDLKKVRAAMSLCTNNKQLVSDEERAAWEYFSGPFYEFVDKAVKDAENGPDSE